MLDLSVRLGDRLARPLQYSSTTTVAQVNPLASSTTATTTYWHYTERTKQMEPILRAKVKIFFKSENLKKNLLIKNDGHIDIIRVYIRQKNWGGCHHLLLVYDASKLSTVYVVK